MSVRMTANISAAPTARI